MIKLLIYDEIGIDYVGHIEMRLGGVSNMSLKHMVMMRREDLIYVRSCDFPLPAFTLVFEEHYNGVSQAPA